MEWLFFLILVFVLPAYFIARMCRSSIRDSLARGVIGLLVTILLQALLCPLAAMFFNQSFDRQLVLSVAAAINLVAFFQQMAAYRRRVQEA